MMKNSSLLAASLLMVFFTLGGCGRFEQEDNAVLRQQVADLQQQVADLQQSQQGNSDSSMASTENISSSGSSTDAASADSIDHTAQSASSEDNPSTQTGSYTIEELTAKAEDFMGRASDIVSAKDTPEMEQFFSLKKELSQLERELDIHEDEMENQYRSGALSRDAYREQERTLEALDDRLDETEDRLELKFGIMD